MASARGCVGGSMDSSIPPGVSGMHDTLNDCVAFEDPLSMDEELPFYPTDDWGAQDASPIERGLYSAPLSWDPPTTRYQPAGEVIRPTYPSAFDVLTPSQQEKLRSIAMPEHLQYQNQHSPNSEGDRRKSGSVSSPDQGDGRRKRKSSAEADDDDDEENGQHPPVKKTAHNMIEKRYRTNLNDKIAALRDSVPSLRVMSKSARGEDTTEDREDLQGLTPAHKLNKATVLSKATEYIRHLEKRNTRLVNENMHLRARITAFERLLLSGPPPINTLFSTQVNPYRYAQEPCVTPPHTTPISPSTGLVENSDMGRLHSVMHQPDYTVSQEMYQNGQNGNRASSGQRQNGGGYFGKMMAGSLAALMVLEGFNETKQDGESQNRRGLFAVPVQLLGPIGRSLKAWSDFSVLGYHTSAGHNLTLLKLILLFGTLLYIFMPSIFSKPKPNKAKSELTSHSLVAAPSLASSIQVRRQAWLTAIQTVWVPQHNFFLEAAALCLKMVKLSLRNAVGWYGYSLLTGITEQREAARVKAWSIALDAQLAGGDIEINRSRLALTLLASCTLPDTPTRLMLKAVHIRVLLWELGNSGFNGYYMFKEFAAKLARWKWNEARQLQQLIIHTRRSPANPNLQDTDALPDYLAALLELDCDDVLVDSIAQRAYNLAFNLPTADNAIGSTDGVDSVVSDFAIRSPLDAISAWFSSLVLQQGLAASLRGSEYESVMQAINLAIDTAPIGSSAQVRALVARAVLFDKSRGTHIAAARQVLSSLECEAGIASMIINTTTPTASIPDLKMSFDCAMAIAHLKRPSFSDPGPACAAANKIQLTNLSLLGFTAAFKLVEALVQHQEAMQKCSQNLEKMAGTLRIWIGGRQGEKSGLPKKTRAHVVETCLDITKRLVGMGKDAGYESMSDQEEDDEGC